MSTPVVLVAGLHAGARAAAVDRLLHRHPGAIAIHHDLHAAASAGRVQRVVRDELAILDSEELPLVRGCVSCTLREDLIPELTRRAGTAPLLIADLWDSVEPRLVAEAVAAEAEASGAIRLTAVLTALDAEHTPVDICRGDSLAECGRQASATDGRYLAEVLARQIEYATGLTIHGGEEDTELTAAVLGHLAPYTPIVTGPDVSGPALCVQELGERVDPATAQLPGDAQTDAIVTVVWHRLRPLHPGRLFDAMDEIVTGSVRSRGRFWLANRPHRMLAWDAVAGLVSVEDSGPWLAALPEAAWDVTPPARRAAAALNWDPVIGDRVQHLVFTGPDLDRRRIHELLDSCLITPEDTMPGAAEWDRFPDPFAPILDTEEMA